MHVKAGSGSKKGSNVEEAKIWSHSRKGSYVEGVRISNKSQCRRVQDQGKELKMRRQDQRKGSHVEGVRIRGRDLM